MLQSFKISSKTANIAAYWTLSRPVKLLSKNKFIFLTKAEVENFYFFWDALDAIYPKLSFKEKIKLLEQFLDCFPNPPVEGENLIDKQKIVFFKCAVFEIQIQNSLKNGNFLL